MPRIWPWQNEVRRDFRSTAAGQPPQVRPRMRQRQQLGMARLLPESTRSRSSGAVRSTRSWSPGRTRAPAPGVFQQALRVSSVRGIRPPPALTNMSEPGGHSTGGALPDEEEQGKIRDLLQSVHRAQHILFWIAEIGPSATKAIFCNSDCSSEHRMVDRHFRGTGGTPVLLQTQARPAYRKAGLLLTTHCAAGSRRRQRSRGSMLCASVSNAPVGAKINRVIAHHIAAAHECMPISVGARSP